MLSVWCLVPGNYPTARRLRPLRSLIEDRTIAEKSIDLILSRYLCCFIPKAYPIFQKGVILMILTPYAYKDHLNLSDRLAIRGPTPAWEGIMA